jgi:hypothetical protein
MLRDSKIHIEISPVTSQTNSQIMVTHSPKHKNLDLLNLDEEIERAVICIPEDADSCCNSNLENKNSIY